ncbi:Aste57867_1470 [Aphanomyces stellatus]|uniref:Aste57867_1470 protein n=1 Tax=Aphanomyces stellatus TaxID=120398 RepID=A0A485K6C6_9STRA|nr:hypothetical protein As57867_001469 [Aphanomyces stellatus]VFT78686.1 Aste57867_1470 [Aphanomyces stellatus]
MPRGIKSVLASRDVLQLVFQFQDGLPEDMRPFATLPLMPSPHPSSFNTFLSKIHELQHQVDVVVTPWLAHYGLARLNCLIECCPRARDIVLAHAAYHGRLDLVQFLASTDDEPYPQAFNPVWLLSVALGHQSVVGFLDARGRHLLPLAGPRPQGCPTLVYFLYDARRPDLPDWFLERMCCLATQCGQLSVLQYLFRALGAATTEQLDSDCLQTAVEYRHVHIQQWLATRIQESTDSEAFVSLFAQSNRATVEAFAPYVDDIMQLVEPVIQSHCRDHDMANLAAILTALSQEATRLCEAKKAALRQMVVHFRVDLLDWLLQQGMDEGDIRDVLDEFQVPDRDNQEFLDELIRPHRNAQEMMDFFARHGVSLAPAMRQHTIATVGLLPLVQWALGDDASMERRSRTTHSLKWVEAIVELSGGDVAFLGQLVLQLASKKRDAHLFPSLYELWVSVADDADDVLRIQYELLKAHKSKTAKFTAALSMDQDSALLGRVAQVSSVDLVKRVLINVTANMSDEGKQNTQADALLRATEGENANVVKWLVEEQVKQGARRNLEAITRALETCVVSQQVNTDVEGYLRHALERLQTALEGT